ncbi:MAG: ABC transporter ATP-binding protein [Planctomycetota bacterium]|nr:MAG: ABC transporter ATP-binding protein [Planctomycetota bacterium]
MGLAHRDFAIRIRNLSKVFRIYRSPLDILREFFTSRRLCEEFVALQNINLEVKKGEVCGFLGRNGAGKSTLLKIVAGILDRTAGEVEINGRVSAILELGSGFHPDYTGRENIVMGGICLGLRRREIQKKMDWIIEFSELGEFIDKPFKTYSTGMQARLTFSTAISVEPEILIIDEALSVGDMKFQSKCTAKMQELRRKGTTIFFVSHDINMINYLCDRAFLLERGRILTEGSPKQVSLAYHELLFGRSQGGGEASEAGEASAVEVRESSVSLREKALEYLRIEGCQGHEQESRYGTRQAEVVDFGILDMEGRPTLVLTSGERYIFYCRVLFYQDLPESIIGFFVRSAKGIDIFGTSTKKQNISVPPQKRGALLEARLPVVMWLGPGKYFLSFSSARTDNLAEKDIFYDIRNDALEFEVVGAETIFEISLANLDPSQIQLTPLAQLCS